MWDYCIVGCFIGDPWLQTGQMFNYKWYAFYSFVSEPFVKLFQKETDIAIAIRVERIFRYFVYKLFEKKFSLCLFKTKIFIFFVAAHMSVDSVSAKL